MKLFPESQDTKIWDIVENEASFPIISYDDGTTANSPKAKWILKHVTNARFYYSKARYYLTCALGRSEYYYWKGNSK